MKAMELAASPMLVDSSCHSSTLSLSQICKPMRLTVIF
jgi:hypothetical protein